jgi:hypothetical protein
VESGKLDTRVRRGIVYVFCTFNSPLSTFHYSLGSFFQWLRMQVVNLAIGVQFPYEPLELSWPVRLAVQDRRFSTCKRGFDSPTGHSISELGTNKGDDTALSLVPRSVFRAKNGDVDQLEGVATLRTWTVWVRIPPSPLEFSKLQTGRRSTGSHKPGCWVQLPGLQLGKG